MIEIDKSNLGITRIKLLHKGKFNAVLGAKFEKLISKHLKENKRIEINLNDLLIIEPDGYPHLSNIVKQASELNCELSFMNVHEDVSEVIDSFSLHSEG